MALCLIKKSIGTTYLLHPKPKNVNSDSNPVASFKKVKYLRTVNYSATDKTGDKDYLAYPDR